MICDDVTFHFKLIVSSNNRLTGNDVNWASKNNLIKKISNIIFSFLNNFISLSTFFPNMISLLPYLLLPTLTSAIRCYSGMGQNLIEQESPLDACTRYSVKCSELKSLCPSAASPDSVVTYHGAINRETILSSIKAGYPAMYNDIHLCNFSYK